MQYNRVNEGKKEVIKMLDIEIFADEYEAICEAFADCAEEIWE